MSRIDEAVSLYVRVMHAADARQSADDAFDEARRIYDEATWDMSPSDLDRVMVESYRREKGEKAARDVASALGYTAEAGGDEG